MIVPSDFEVVGGLEEVDSATCCVEVGSSEACTSVPVGGADGIDGMVGR